MNKYWRLNSEAIHKSVNCYYINGKKSFLDKYSSDKGRQLINLDWLGVVELITVNQKDCEMIFYSAQQDKTFACDQIAFLIQFKPITPHYNTIWNKLND